ncbi:MAG: CBS domain-containing protein [Deltaproteobacteria bacterium]|nr:CBS domain-containing protein [Deltaproteobacteria bacterium]
MFVKDWMQRDVIIVEDDDPILDAVHLMKENNIRQLPVVHKGRLVGIITEKDVKEFSPSKASSLDIYEVHNILAKTTVKEAMSANVISVNPDDPIERAALILRDKRFGGLPVVDNNHSLVGIITAVDVFDVFVEAMGMRTPGSRITIEVEDRPGAIADMTRIVKSFGINIISLATFYLKKEDRSLRDVVYRVACDDPSKIALAVEALKKENFKITSVLSSEQLMIMED